MYRVCIPEPFYNCDKIYPIQQKKVKQLLDILLKNNNVLEVVIFGSSVTDSCHVGSNIDIYVKLIRNQKNLIDDVIYFRYDLWTNFYCRRKITERDRKEWCYSIQWKIVIRGSIHEEHCVYTYSKYLTLWLFIKPSMV